MNEIRKTFAEPMMGEYVTPQVGVMLFQPEGVLCSSVMGIENEDFEDGGYYEI